MKVSSVSLGLLGSVIVLFFAGVDELDGIGVLPSSHGLFTLLVGHERLGFFNIIEFAISETDMVPFVSSSPDRGEEVGCGHEHELRNVENENKLDTVPLVEPHPISVRLQTHGLQSEELKIVRTTSGPPVSVRLVFVEELAIVALNIVIVGVSASSTRWLSAHF